MKPVAGGAWGSDVQLVRVSAAAARDPGLLRRAVPAALAAGVPAADLHEALLQAYLFLGYPRAINALAEFRAAAARAGVDVPEPDREASSIPAWRRRGLQLCRIIYGAKFEKMIANMRRLHTRLAEWILWEGYGKVLGRPRLDPRRRELCVLGILAVDGAIPQLAAHVRGALNAGAARAEVAAVRALVRRWVPARLRADVDAAFALSPRAGAQARRRSFR